MTRAGAAAAGIAGEAVRPPNDEGGVAGAVVPATQAFRKCTGVEGLAARIEQHGCGIFRDDVGERDRLFQHTALRIARAALGDFHDLKRAQADPAARFRRALAIALGELLLRPALEPPDSRD